MTEPSDVVFLSGLDVFSGVVERLAPDAWQRPSPCAGWRAIDVLGHLGSSIAFGVALLKGEPFTFPQSERPGELVDDEPRAYWERIATGARSALIGADLDQVRDSPMGPRTVAQGLAFPAIDLFVHAWDIGQAAGFNVEVPAAVIEFSHAVIDPVPAEMVRGPKGAFGPEVAVADDASASDRFIAWTGRRPLRPTG